MEPRRARGGSVVDRDPDRDRPDVIHLATAIDEGADVFITGDAALARCTEIAVDVLTPTP